MYKTVTCLGLIGAVLCLTISAQARTKLTALPEASGSLIRMDNPAATLIEEERVLTLQQGQNQVDFSWNGVSIDPDSIRLSILDKEVSLLSVSYPPNEPALIWDISSARAAEVTVRICYLLSNIDRLTSYKVVADQQETAGSLQQYMILRNFSGQDFDQADLLLSPTETFKNLTIRQEETSQFLARNIARVPLEKQWNWDARQQPWDPEYQAGNIGIPVHYKIANSAQNKLGQRMLWSGRVRVYQQDGSGSTIFLGEDDIPQVPVGEDIEVYIGNSRDIVVTQHKMKDQRINIRRNNAGHVVLYDTEEEIKATIENFKDTPAQLTMTQYIPNQWKMQHCSLPYERKNAETLEFNIELPPHEKQELVMKYNRFNLR